MTAEATPALSRQPRRPSRKRSGGTTSNVAEATPPPASSCAWKISRARVSSISRGGEGRSDYAEPGTGPVPNAWDRMRASSASRAASR